MLFTPHFKRRFAFKNKAHILMFLIKILTAGYTAYGLGFGPKNADTGVS